MARPEPFRALLDKAKQSEAQPEKSALALRVLSAASSSVSTSVDDSRDSLDQRLDAVVLAAGTTPMRARRSVRVAASSSLVPLRLDKPPPSSPRTVDERSGPAPRMLQFIAEEGRVGGLGEESVSGNPRLEPVQESGKVAVAVGVRTNVYRLSGRLDDSSQSRPLPVLGDDDDDDAGTIADDADTRAFRRVEKVLTLKSINALDVRVQAFSSSDTDSDIIEIIEEAHADLERAPRAAAALALPVLSEEGVETIVDFADELGGDIDELARQLGLEGTVPRTTPPTPADDFSSDVFANIDDAEYVAVTIPTNPMRAVVVSRSLLSLEALNQIGSIATTVDDTVAFGAINDREDAKDVDVLGVVASDEADDHVVSDDDVIDEVALCDDADASSLTPSSARPLPLSLLREPDPTGFDDEHQVTPAHGTIRPSLQAPSAVRFFVAEAPARPRRAALSSAELERSRARAHELYLVALDDIACRDVRSAVVHLELALAYDDESPLYHDLLGQLQRKIASKAPETHH